MPTEYFEVKPERVVNIGEFSGAALPGNVDPKVKAILKKHGVPFKIYKTEEERQAVTASFQRKKGVLFSQAPMYSALTRAAEAPKFPAKLPAKSVINQLKKASGVKQVEIDVSGLSEWLEGKDRVSKVALVDFLKMTEVRVEEIEKGIADLDVIADRADELFDEAVSERVAEIEEETGEEPDRDDVSNAMSYQDYYEDAEKEIEDEVKFAEHVLPGGEPGSYRELVLKVPGFKALRYEVRPFGSGFRVWDTQENIFLLGGAQNKEVAQSKATTLNAEIKRAYKSPHWDEPNVIAHIRGDTRIDVDGKRRFHVAEFQSDIYSRIVELEATQKWELIAEDGSVIAADFATEAEARVTKRSVDETRARFKKGPVRVRGNEELANLKKLFPWGENWHELVAKKALEYAVKNDLDGISWDTAKTQVDRWESALRKSVDEIEWEKHTFRVEKEFRAQGRRKGKPMNM
jgi:hypothetical protein